MQKWGETPRSAVPGASLREHLSSPAGAAGQRCETEIRAVIFTEFLKPRRKVFPFSRASGDSVTRCLPTVGSYIAPACAFPSAIPRAHGPAVMKKAGGELAVSFT